MAAAFHCLAPSRQLQSSIRKSRTEGSVCWFNPAALSRRPGDEEPDFSSVELLISTGPVELAIKYLGCCPKLRRVVCLSTSSVLSKVDSEDLKERELVGRIATAEQQLQASCADRQLELAILRPTLIYGCGMDANISLLAQLRSALWLYAACRPGEWFAAADTCCGPGGSPGDAGHDRTIAKPGFAGCRRFNHKLPRDGGADFRGVGSQTPHHQPSARPVAGGHFHNIRPGETGRFEPGHGSATKPGPGV